jgi:hypothetical protein
MCPRLKLYNESFLNPIRTKDTEAERLLLPNPTQTQTPYLSPNPNQVLVRTKEITRRKERTLAKGSMELDLAEDIKGLA